ncbi:hypothetical protein E9531_04150 [Lampropedia puyangensis]|uniref:Acyltransferase 3 domain-containing protein n=1 Tax=Lampropedia puyangensis TaxID=1330072 RepID=A0A4S8FC52_9BURK|nr:acyltransferase family protein [Lampropedia puyangensis]THU04581.1 hypothetical protein E9531_04150 [Lampropedia puyangensis]
MTQRNKHLDAAKGVLVFLVLLGHVLHYSRQVPILDVLYRWLYLFHMPAFVFLSGMVSSSILDSRRARALLFSVLLPFLVHQAVQSGLLAYLIHKPWQWALSQPVWAMWYLSSLLCWRLMLPLLAQLKYPLFVSVAIALLAGLDAEIGTAWSLSRTFGFLPFFVAGYLWGQRSEKLSLPSLHWGWAVMGLSALLLVAVLTRHASISWWYWFVGYSALGASATTGMLYRALLLLCGAVGVVSILSLVGAIKDVNRLAVLGAASITPYLLHMYVIVVADHVGMGGWIASLPAAIGVAVVVCCTMLLTWVLAQVGRKFPGFCDFSWLERHAVTQVFFRMR